MCGVVVGVGLSARGCSDMNFKLVKEEAYAIDIELQVKSQVGSLVELCYVREESE